MKPLVEKSFVVISKKGRDKGRVFVVLSSMDAYFVMISDGDTRKLDHLKKKKRLHLQAIPHELPEIVVLYEKKKLKDSDIRKALAPFKVPEGFPQLDDNKSNPIGVTTGNARPDADDIIEGGSLFVQK